jgi:hypothetical protein
MPVAAGDGTSGNSRTFQGISTPGLDVRRRYIRGPAGRRSCGGVDLGAPRLSLLEACPLSGSVSLCVSLSTLLGWQSSREAPPASLSTPPHTSLAFFLFLRCFITYPRACSSRNLTSIYVSVGVFLRIRGVVRCVLCKESRL